VVLAISRAILDLLIAAPVSSICDSRVPQGSADARHLSVDFKASLGVVAKATATFALQAGASRTTANVKDATSLDASMGYCTFMRR